MVICATAGVVLLAVIGFVVVRRRRLHQASAGFVSLKDGSEVPLVDSTGDLSSGGHLKCIVKVCRVDFNLYSMTTLPI